MRFVMNQEAQICVEIMAVKLEAIEKIAHTLERDLDRSGRENDYLTDAMAAAVKRAGKSLKSCGISISVDSRVNKLAWFVGGNASKIRQLQKGLNTLECGERLTEDGVYGKKHYRFGVNFFKIWSTERFPHFVGLMSCKVTRQALRLEVQGTAQKRGSITPLSIINIPIYDLIPLTMDGRGGFAE